MTIISVSLPSETSKELEQLQKQHAFSGRSELLREAIAAYSQRDYRKHLVAEREYVVAVSLTIAETQKSALHTVTHEFQGAIKAHNHLCIDAKRCLETYCIRGKGASILSFLDRLEAIPKASKITVCYEECENA
jgi:CopG family nickel-responsive transcriptional regulator